MCELYEVIIVIILRKLNFFHILIKNTNIKTQRLKLLDENLERFRNARMRNIFAFYDRLVGLYTSYDIVGLDRKDFLQRKGSTVSFKRPDFHFTEALSAELSFTAERLLGNK